MDPYGTNPWKRSDNVAVDGTFDATLNELALLQLLADPNAILVSQASSKSTESTTSLAEADYALLDASAVSASDSSVVHNMLFNGYVKTLWVCTGHSMDRALTLRDT
jgi:hypothetical protein